MKMMVKVAKLRTNALIHISPLMVSKSKIYEPMGPLGLLLYHGFLTHYTKGGIRKQSVNG